MPRYRIVYKKFEHFQCYDVQEKTGLFNWSWKSCSSRSSFETLPQAEAYLNQKLTLERMETPLLTRVVKEV